MNPAPEHEGPLARAGDWIVATSLAATGFLAGFGAQTLGLTPEADLDLQRTVLGLLCIFSAFLLFHVRRLLRRVRAAEELLADVRFGPGTKRDRDAVDILVQALRVPDANARETALRTLRKISGLDLGEDPRPWEEWWSVARATFVRLGGPPAEKK